MRETDLIKRIYILKKINKVRLNETYTENRLKHFRILKVRIENVKEKKINLTKSLKDVEEFEKIIEIVEKSFEKNCEMKEENFNQIEKLKEDRRNAQNSSKNAAESINEENKIFENNIMIINFDYNVVEKIIIVVKTKNETLRNIALR